MWINMEKEFEEEFPKDTLKILEYLYGTAIVKKLKKNLNIN